MDLVVVLIHQWLAAMQAGYLSGLGVVIKHTHGAVRDVCLYTGGCGGPMQLPR